MFRRIFHPKQNQDPTLYEKSWGVFRLGRFSARTILIVGTILVYLFSNWTGNAIQALIVALFSGNFGFFSGHGLAYTLHFLSVSLVNPTAFFHNEDLLGLISAFQNMTFLAVAVHWVSTLVIWYLFVWRPFIHIWTKSRPLNHNEQGMSRIATPEEVRWQTFKVPDRKYNYQKHSGFPVMHTFNWRGKLNHMIKTEMGNTQHTLHISDYEVGRLYLFTLSFCAVVLFLVSGSIVWGAIAYHTTGSIPLLSLYRIWHPLMVIAFWLVASLFKMVWVLCQMQVVAIHYPFTGGLMYVAEIFGIGWLISHIKDVIRHYHESEMHAIIHSNIKNSFENWWSNAKEKSARLKNGDGQQVKHINNADEHDPALQYAYYNDKSESAKVVDCFFHHPGKTIKLAYMEVMNVLVNLNAGITGWYYLSPRPHNVWIYGTSGSGKGQMVVNPMMDINSRADPKDKPNMIVTDPKGESAAGASVMLKKRGYNVKVMNILDLSHSMSFNPLRLVIKYAQLGAIGQAEDSCSQLSFTIYDPAGQGQNSYFYTSAASLFDAMTFALIALAHSRYYGLDDIVTYDDNGTKEPVLDDGQYKDGDDVDSNGHYVQKLSDGKWHSDINAFSKVTIHNISEMVAQLGGQDGQEQGEQEPEKQLMIYFDHLNEELNKLRTKQHENPYNFSDVLKDQLSILDQAQQKFQQSKLAGSKTAGSIYSTFLDRLRIYMSSDVAKMTSMDNFNPAEMGFDRLLTIQFNRAFKLQHITTKSWNAFNGKDDKPVKVLKNKYNEPIDIKGVPIVKNGKTVSGSKDNLQPTNWGKRSRDYVPITKVLAKNKDGKQVISQKFKKLLTENLWHFGYTRKPIGHIETNKGHLSEIGVGHIPFEKQIKGDVFFITIDMNDERVEHDYHFTFECVKNYFDVKTYEQIKSDYKKAPQVADMEVVYRNHTDKKGNPQIATLTAVKSGDIKDFKVIDKYTKKPVLRNVSIHMVQYPSSKEYAYQANRIEQQKGNNLHRLAIVLQKLARNPKKVFIKQQAHFLYNPHPTAWFIVVPQNKKELNQLGTFAIGQTFNVLSGISMSFTNGRHVQRPMQMILDELGNLPAIRSLDTMASFGRSQHIYIMPIFQAREQADKIYKKDVTNIIYDNCPTTVYILSNSEPTIKDISAGFGNRTVTNTTRSYDPAKLKSINYNENEMKQAVMPPDILRNLRLGEAAILRTTDRTNVWGQDSNPWPIFDWDGRRDTKNGHLKKIAPSYILPYSWWFLAFSHGSLASVPVVTPHKYLDLESLTIPFEDIYLWFEVHQKSLDITLFQKLQTKVQSSMDKWKNTGYIKHYQLLLADATQKNEDGETQQALQELFQLEVEIKQNRVILTLSKGEQIFYFTLSVLEQHSDLKSLVQSDYSPSASIDNLYTVVNRILKPAAKVHILRKVMTSNKMTYVGQIASACESLDTFVTRYLTQIGLLTITKHDGMQSETSLTQPAKDLIDNPQRIKSALNKVSIDYAPQVPLSTLISEMLKSLQCDTKFGRQHRGLMFMINMLEADKVKGFITGASGMAYSIQVNFYGMFALGLFDAITSQTRDQKKQKITDRIKSPLTVSKYYNGFIKNLNDVSKRMSKVRK